MNDVTKDLLEALSYVIDVWVDGNGSEWNQSDSAAQARSAIAAAEAQQADEACPTCGGSGAIGGFRHGEGYDQEPCPDCTKQAEPVRLTDEEIEALRRDTFSTDNPFCPCDRKTMRKAARAAEQAVLRKQGFKVEG